MNKLNNKGYMLVEIILASVLAFGLAFFLLELTIKLKNKNDDLLVRTLVSTDQAIVMNTIMKVIEEDFDNFECSDISFESVDEGTAFKLNGDVKSIITEFATVKYDATSDTYCNINYKNKTANINIEMSVIQLPDENFDSKIEHAGVVCPKSLKNPNEPLLDESGMIPVIISNDGTVTTVSSNNINNEWYNYDEKRWANVVLVTESSRDNYLNTTGKSITLSDILAYYVWIPRYSYAISNGENAREICIQFEEESDTKRTGTAKKRSYYTHPAFTFDDLELSGLWVGKFETTGNEINPTILPNVEPLNEQNVSTQFITSLRFAGGTLTDGLVEFSGSSEYGLISSTDSHMMKNSEWGATVYLAHSLYGINREVRLNNYADNSSGSYILKTGCGALSENAAMSSTCSNSYGSGISEYAQSTTGNITGIFDMSGGGWDAVMAVTAYSDGTPHSGQYNGSTDFDGYACNAPVADLDSPSESDCQYEYYDGETKFPDEKYYDIYTIYSGKYSINTACNGGICYGHALSETSGWYDDIANFPHRTPWTYRGSNFASKTSSGIFAYSRDQGTSGDNGIYSFRSVIVVS